MLSYYSRLRSSMVELERRPRPVAPIPVVGSPYARRKRLVNSTLQAGNVVMAAGFSLALSNRLSD